jgi:hypothetical protein
VTVRSTVVCYTVIFYCTGNALQGGAPQLLLKCKLFAWKTIGVQLIKCDSNFLTFVVKFVDTCCNDDSCTRV